MSGKQYINNSSIFTLDRISILIYLIVFFNSDISESMFWYWFSTAFCFIMLLIKIFYTNFKISLDIYSKWRIALLFIVAISYIWTYSQEYSLIGIKLVAIQSIVMMLLLTTIKTDKDLLTAIRLYIIASIITFLYVLFHMNLFSVGINRIGADLLGERWNSNLLGILASFSIFLIVIALKFSLKYKKYLILLPCFIFFSLISGSRKSFLILIMGTLLFLLLKSKNKIRNLIISAISIVILSYLVINVPLFYDILGLRIITFLNYFNDNNSTVDQSTLLRIDMIRNGIQYFFQKPFFGYGINAYRILYGNQTNWYTYSHNNFIELGVGIGLVGLFIYYGFVFTLTYKLWKLKTKLSKYFFALILILIIIDFSMVSYYSILNQFILCLCYAVYKIEKSRR